MSDDTIIKLLAALSEKLQTAGYDISATFQLPSSALWSVSPGMPPKQIASAVPADLSISILTDEAYERFLSGKCIPQQEILAGDWSIDGSDESAMKLTQLFYEC